MFILEGFSDTEADIETTPTGSPHEERTTVLLKAQPGSDILLIQSHGKYRVNNRIKTELKRWIITDNADWNAQWNRRSEMET